MSYVSSSHHEAHTVPGSDAFPSASPHSLLWETLWCNHSLQLVIGQGCWSWSKCVVSDQKPWSEAPFCTASIYWRTVPFEEFGLWGLSWPGSKHHLLGGGLWYLWDNATWYSNGHSNCEGKEPGMTALLSLYATSVSSTHSVFFWGAGGVIGTQWYKPMKKIY